MGKVKERFLSQDREKRQRLAVRNIRDSVFTKLFSNRKNVLELYREINPDDTTVRLKDIKVVTIRNVIANGVYNDLGFTVRGDQLYLIEAQSTKGPYLPFRMGEYFIETVYVIKTDFSRKKYSPTGDYLLPNPHFYTVYTGKEKVPEVYDSAAFFSGPPPSVSYTVTVLTNEKAVGILKSYFMFCAVYDEMRAAVENHDEAVAKTIRYCIEHDILRDFFLENEAEVRKIMRRINEQEEIYNGMMNAIDEQKKAIDEKDKAMDRMEKDYSNQLNKKDRTIKKKDNEIKKLREIIGSCGISPEALALKLKA